MGKDTEKLNVYTLSLGSLAALLGIAAVNNTYQDMKKIVMEYRGFEAISRDVQEFELKGYDFRKRGS